VFAKDINLTGASVLGLIIGLFFTSAELIHLKLDVPILGEILEFFQGLKTTVNVGFWKVLAVIAAIYIAVYCLPWALLKGRHELSSRSVEQILVGRQSLMTPAAGLSVAVEWYDLIEFGLGLGAGSLIFRNRSGTVMKRIDNIEPISKVSSSRGRRDRERDKEDEQTNRRCILWDTLRIFL
jgi:hypothetical protein